MTERKRNGKTGRNLPARTPSARQLAALWQGNPDNRGGGDKPDSFRIRAAQRLEEARGLDVMGSILSGDILELVGVQKTGEPIIGFTRNADRIAAFRELKDAAGYGPAKPINIETAGDVQVIVVYDDQ